MHPCGVVRTSDTATTISSLRNLSDVLSSWEWDYYSVLVLIVCNYGFELQLAASVYQSHCSILSHDTLHRCSVSLDNLNDRDIAPVGAIKTLGYYFLEVCALCKRYLRVHYLSPLHSNGTQLAN